MKTKLALMAAMYLYGYIKEQALAFIKPAPPRAACMYVFSDDVIKFWP